MSTITRRVAAGAAFLDEHEPGWWKRIDLDTLDLESSCRCVLGQLWVEAAVNDGAGELDAFDYGIDGYGISGADGLGFDTSPFTDEYPALTAEWKRLITARRAGAP